MAIGEKYYTTDVNNNELPSGIVYTTIVAEDSRKKIGSTVGRAVIGAALLGPVGLLAGATGKNSRTTTFLVQTNDGQTRNIIVYTDSPAFNTLCKYLNGINQQNNFMPKKSYEDEYMERQYEEEKYWEKRNIDEKTNEMREKREAFEQKLTDEQRKKIEEMRKRRQESEQELHKYNS